MEKTQMTLLGIGIILIAIAFVKFSIIGYYPDEALTYGVILLGGVLCCYVASKIKTEEDEK